MFPIALASAKPPLIIDWLFWVASFWFWICTLAVGPALVWIFELLRPDRLVREPEPPLDNSGIS